ncbi:ATP synthase subunit I [Burkholderia ubonensis]|uniref:ATP synthase subunit I n=1 Tax=Burkholderia ubonensis TaxID=101571 RepID=A0A105QNA9_9BURK|nr:MULTISPECIES: ATP synthase subunit I [Burkholderia]AJX17974.1 ATP synthase I chain family protein [Burkholderia ubonensis MSMB22]AOK21951.1 ATP synthase subunit I [Burkholderia ubonensis]KIP15350.1 ATP synthase I chain family protein [Burkholderia sp. MSHR3999]KVA76552.1 ATP synthase subunit I [Burkholderia ubonensis]KVC78208.1 ATP synthase subunit I [Burkholderia ubonensis]
MAGQAPKGRHDDHRAQRTASAAGERRESPGDDWDAELQDDNIVPLTRAEAEKLFGPNVSRPSRMTPYKVVIAQVALSLVATLAWWLFSKSPGAAAQSAFLGGAIGWVPSALFVARLKAGGSATVMSWVAGEALKLGVTIGMFAAVAFGYPGVHWVPLLVTYLVVLKTYWIALAWR